MIRDKRMLGYTYALSFKSEHRVPVAAILSKGKTIIKQATNVEKTHPLQKNQYMRNKYSQSHAPSTHAELMVLGNYEYDNRYSLYVCRRRKDGSFGLALPCPICMKIIERSGIKKVIYSISGTIDKPHYGVIII